MAVILHVTIVPAGAGGVQPSPRGDYISPGRVSYPEGTVVTLTAIPSIVGAYFDHWEGDATGTDNPTVIIMNSDKAITVVFGIEEIPEYPTFQLTTGVIGGGSVAPSEGIFNEGDRVIIVAYPDDGWLFDSWSGDTEGTAPVPGMPNNLQVTMDRDRHIIAHFVEEVAPPPPPELAWLYTDVVGEGGIKREPADNAFPIGTVVTLTAIPDSGYRFFEWRGDLSGISPVESIMMNEDKYVTALFEPIPPPPPPAEPEFRGFAVNEYTRL